MRTLVWSILLVSMGVSAMEEVSCVQKIEALRALKAQRVSGLEKTAGFLLSGGFLGFSDDQEEALLEERIRVLEMELKRCR